MEMHMFWIFVTLLVVVPRLGAMFFLGALPHNEECDEVPQLTSSPA